MKVPAVVVYSGSSFQIASLSILDRLIVALHRAGAGKITVVTDFQLPSLKRTRALNIPFSVDDKAPMFDEGVLFAKAEILAHPTDLRRCIETESRLLSMDGEPLPVGVIDESGPVSESRLEILPGIRAEKLACRVTDRASARMAEKKLWSSMTSASDGLMDKIFNRPCGRPLARLLIHTPVSPNMISVASILLGLLAAWFFGFGTYQSIGLGAILFQISAIVDCIDGDVARIVFKESPLGKWIDLVGDQVVHIAVFAGIAVGVARSRGTPEILWLGVSAVIGALISFAVVLRGMRLVTSQNSKLKRLIDSATNRDFSVLVLLLAAFDLLEIFLWLVATGSHFFWIAALKAQSIKSVQSSLKR